MRACTSCSVNRRAEPRIESGDSMLDKIKNFLFPRKPKVTDYFKNPDMVAQRKGKFSDGVCIENCGSTFFCDGCGTVENCSWIQKNIPFDRTKPSAKTCCAA